MFHYEIQIADVLETIAEQLVILARQKHDSVECTFNGIPISVGYQVEPSQIIEAWVQEKNKRDRARTTCKEANDLVKVEQSLRNNAEQNVALPIALF